MSKGHPVVWHLRSPKYGPNEVRQTRCGKMTHLVQVLQPGSKFPDDVCKSCKRSWDLEQQAAGEEIDASEE